jgi:hypothetical protein
VDSQTPTAAQAWREVELTLSATHDVADAYTAVDVWADFVHDSGITLRRPAFWDGGRTWRIRFASPLASGRWGWKTSSNQPDAGLNNVSGEVRVDPADGGEHRFYRHGFWRMSRGGRSLVHADGTPAILVGDTAWALPWRATEDQVRVYAEDRHAKGFNAVLLMTVQPDMRATGPRDRTQDEGFDVGFEDLPRGHLNELVPTYFQYMDRLLTTLVSHEIVPVLSPVFQGFGWKGLDVAGTVVPAAEYARYCRYLVARSGARPVIYLVGADGSGYEPQVPAGGEAIEQWDCYRQPTGIHYRPHSTNRAWQDASWLDFQWCQTGHGGEHVPERVADMWRNDPARGVANGEPTYEHTRVRSMASGWWQGHEAWSNLCAGGTMGVVYGAASMWQWRLHRDEGGHAAYFLAPEAGWREALEFEGSQYVGLVNRILDGLPTTDMQPDVESFISPRALGVPGRLQIVYSEFGGLITARSADAPVMYRIVDPRSGELIGEGRRDAGTRVLEGTGDPRVYVFATSSG